MIIFVVMITYYIIGATVCISLIAMNDNSLKAKMMFNPYMISHEKEWYRFFSSGLIHADWMHLFFNMYSLYMFGTAVEQGYHELFEGKATLFFILLYVTGLALSSMYEYEKNKNNIYYNALGASGAVSSVVFAFIIMAPTQTLGFMFLPGIRPPAYLFGAIFLGVEYYLDKKGGSNIGHNAHFWGAVHGVVFTIILKPQLVNYFIEQLKQ
jgi:membrane associated rhomboid family serine protease